MLGNPPYNGFAGVSPKEEGGLVEPYKKGLIAEWGIKKFNLDDLYIRFFRLAERRIAEMTGKGVVCYISNHSWVSDRLSSSCANISWPHLTASGSRTCTATGRFRSTRRTAGRARRSLPCRLLAWDPARSGDFALGKSGKKPHGAQVLFRDDLNAAKANERRTQLLESLKVKGFDANYEAATPDGENRYSFRPATVSKLIAYGPACLACSERAWSPTSIVVIATGKATLHGRFVGRAGHVTPCLPVQLRRFAVFRSIAAWLDTRLAGLRQQLPPRRRL